LLARGQGCWAGREVQAGVGGGVGGASFTTINFAERIDCCLLITEDSRNTASRSFIMLPVGTFAGLAWPN